MTQQTGKLILSDGTFFLGQTFGAEINSSGEVVFNTGMVGYPESLTDPSYFGQILVLTFPLIGNYGVPDKRFWESSRIQVRGLIVQNYIDSPSHFKSTQTLATWLKAQNIPALFGIDTRALTTKLRYKGVMLGKIEVQGLTKSVIPAPYQVRGKLQRESNGSVPAKAGIKSGMTNLYDPNSENILPFVSISQPQTFGEGKKHIILIDCGAKQNILKSLLKRKVRATVVPWDFDPFVYLEAGGFDGVLISNGPGDPKLARATIKNVAKLIKNNIPIFGICLGSQILGLAAGGDTYKLKFGHRSQNQPVQDVSNKKALITSQNHGFAVQTQSLSSDWQEWFVNLNDGTNEGIRHKTKPFLAVQFHPEATPGPVDANYLFDEFLSYV